MYMYIYTVYIIQRCSMLSLRSLLKLADGCEECHRVEVARLQDQLVWMDEVHDADLDGHGVCHGMFD